MKSLPKQMVGFSVMGPIKINTAQDCAFFLYFEQYFVVYKKV